MSFDFWFIFGFLGGIAFGWAGPMDGCVDWCVKKLEARLKTQSRQNGVARAVDKITRVFDEKGNSIPVEVGAAYPQMAYPQGHYCRAGMEVVSTPFPEEADPKLLIPQGLKPHNL